MRDAIRSPAVAITLILQALVLASCSPITAEGKPPTGPTPATLQATPAPPTRAVATPTFGPPTPAAPSLPDLGLAPDFTNEVWINTETPLTLEKLRGKVVLVEFWTFG
jgi:hypothetical protein